MEPDLQDGDTQKGDSGDAHDGDREISELENLKEMEPARWRYAKR